MYGEYSLLPVSGLASYDGEIAATNFWFVGGPVATDWSLWFIGGPVATGWSLYDSNKNVPCSNSLASEGAV